MTVFFKLFLVAATLPAAVLAQTDPMLYQKPANGAIRDTRFGPLADFQHALAAKAAQCHLQLGPEDKFADGRYGQSTAAALQKVLACLSITTADPSGRTITAAVWKAVALGLALPTAKQRARAMAFLSEGTDYTDIEFNVGTSDPGILTWGPMGATAGQSFQVQRILVGIDHANPQLIDRAFGSQAAAIRTFTGQRTTASATAAVSAVKADRSRQAQWRRGFQMLASDRGARTAYDDLMDASATAGIPEAIADFYHSYWRHCWVPTEVDYGFFLDRAVQMDVRREKTDAAMDQVKLAEDQAHATFSPAQRRRAIAANFPAGSKNQDYVHDRLSRDVSFYIEGVGPASLENTSFWQLRTNLLPRPAGLKDELTGWKSRLSITAANYGLSDSRNETPPQALRGAIPACVAGAYLPR